MDAAHAGLGATMEASLKCYRCGHKNQDQAFCGSCGWPLALNEYLSKSVKEQIGLAVRDRDVLETESSIRVFERAWGWVKIVMGISAALLAILGGGVVWKVSDWRSSVDSAKQAVTDTSNAARKQIEEVSSRSAEDITKTASNANQAIQDASTNAERQSNELKKAASQTKREMLQERLSLRNDVETSRSQLQAADKLEPEMTAMSHQLAQATSEIQAQQKVISSSEDFVKSVFSSHTVDFFWVGQGPDKRYAVLPPPAGGKQTAVFLLLRSTPIPETLQLQFHIFTQPQNSYFRVAHNLVIFFWADPPDNLKQQQLSVAYFPDSGDKELIQSLEMHDGRVFADGEPLPKFNQPDPDFKGSKWIHLEAPAK